jgi:hypothetical protein
VALIFSLTSELVQNRKDGTRANQLIVVAVFVSPYIISSAQIEKGSRVTNLINRIDHHIVRCSLTSLVMCTCI